MNPLELQLQYPLGEALPDHGHTLEVAPGVRWVRMTLPFALNHINLWLLKDEIDGEPGWTIVDCGLGNADTEAAWEQVFANELEGLPVLRVIVTHMHPDHIGSSDWLTRRWTTPQKVCRLWISATDYYCAQLARNATISVGGERAALFMASHGMTDPQSLEAIRKRSNYYNNLVPALPTHYRRLQHSHTVRIGAHDWECHAGYGHAPEHISLHCPSLNVLISGDMLLPRISTNISVIEHEPESNPLPQYLESLEHLRTLPADTLVLPSHGRPFKGMYTRISQLQDHHAERLAATKAACLQSPQSAFDILAVMFNRPLDLHQTSFAMGESLAHLHALWLNDRLRRTRGDDGIYRFGAK